MNTKIMEPKIKKSYNIDRVGSAIIEYLTIWKGTAF